jgi:hypothetical protein
MKKIFITLCLLFSFFPSFAQNAEYKPPSEKSYAVLKEVFPDFSDADIKEARKKALQPENVKLINDILPFLKYRRLIDKDIKVPEIYFVFMHSNKASLRNLGGMYVGWRQIILLNADMLVKKNKFSEASNFITFSPILAHEIKHHEDAVKNAARLSSAVLEKNAYAQSVKVIDAFLRMNEDTAATIDIDNFYAIVNANRDYIAKLRKRALLNSKAADILLKNKKALYAKLGIREGLFNLLGFEPELQVNAKNGGHIVNVSADLHFYNVPGIRPLRFAVNTISEEVKILSSPKEIASFKNKVKEFIPLDL